MKRKYMMMPMMISDPKQPGNDINVYLTPLIKDLKLLWEEVIDVEDAYTGDNFKLHMVICLCEVKLLYDEFILMKTKLQFTRRKRCLSMVKHYDSRS